MKVKMYNLQGKATGELDLLDEVFNTPIKPEVVHEVYVAQNNNSRQPWADTKNRGEVSGGGKKPWKQKGTGRARHGSTRSPIWAGGGVAFGPTSDRNYKTKINNKKRRLAIKMCLTDKLQTGNLLVVEDFNFAAPKTKEFVAFLKTLPGTNKSWLVLSADKNDNLIRMTNNVKKVKTEMAAHINVVDLISKQTILGTKDALLKIQEIFNK